MIIESMLTVALIFAENEIQPECPIPDPPPIVCYEEGGELTCYPIDLQEKGFNHEQYNTITGEGARPPTTKRRRDYRLPSQTD